MAISLVAGSNLSNGVANGNNVSISWPTLQQNDVTYVAVCRRTTVAISMNTSGYTEIGGTGRVRVFRKVQGATPDTTASANGDGNTNNAMAIVGFALRGVDTSTPEDATATNASGSSTNPDCASITTVTNGAWVLAFAGSEVNDASITAPSGYSNGVSATSNDTNPASCAGATKLVSTAGAENPASFTTWSTGAWAAVTVAVRPQAGATGTLAATEDGVDTSSMSGTVIKVSGALAATEAQDTSTASGTTAKNGTLAATEAQDTSTASGTTAKNGTLAATEAQDTSTASGTTAKNGTLAATESADTFAATGFVTDVTGTLDATEAEDTFAATGAAAHTGTMAATEAEDTSDFSGLAIRNGTLAATDAQDVFDAVGTLPRFGTLAATEAQDTFNAVGLLPVSGTLAATEAADTFVADGYAAHYGALAATEVEDTAALTGAVFQVGGTLEATEAQDDLVAYGSISQVQGSLDATEPQDVFEGAGLRHAVLTGTLAVLEAQDTALMTGRAFHHSVGMPDAKADAEAQRLVADIGPDIHADAEVQKLHLDAGIAEAVGTATAVEPLPGVSYFHAIINKVYSSVEPLFPMFRDAVVTADQLHIDFSHALFDSVQATENIVELLRFRQINDTVTVTDKRGLEIVWVRAFADSVTLQDSPQFADLFGSFLSDSVTVFDLFGKALSKQRGDTVTMADSASPAVGPGPQDSATPTDAFARTMDYRRTFGDVAAMSESMARNVGKTRTDSVTMSDQKFGGWGKAVADNLFVADARTRIIGKALSDGPTMSDGLSISIGYRRTLVDSVGATDIFSALLNDRLGLSDSITAASFMYKGFGKNRNESVTATDARVTSVSKPVGDSVTISSSGEITGQSYANNYFAEDYVSGTLATFT